MNKKYYSSKLKKLTAYLTSVLLLAYVWFACPVYGVEQAAQPDAQESASGGTYDVYYESIKELKRVTAGIDIPAVTALISADSAGAAAEQDGEKAVFLNADNSYAEWEFTVTEEGVYPLWLTFAAVSDDQADIELSLLLDGKVPFEECENLTLKRLWKDETENGSFAKDYSGNEVHPNSVQLHIFNTQTLYDSLGLYNEPYLFHLKAGKHTVRLSSTSGIALKALCFKNSDAPISYAEYREQHSSADSGTETAQYRVEAEHTAYKNVRTIYPSYDTGNCSTLPNSPTSICLNTIGQSSWNKQGEALTWNIPIKSAGYYQIAFRARQNKNTSSSSFRTLKINGEIPFAQAENIEFPYKTSWYIKKFEGDAPFCLWLEPGDVITLECSLTGESSEISRNISASVRELNSIYRDIIVVTGTSPDIYRDYALEKQIPTLMEDMRSSLENLNSTAELMSANGKKASPNLSTVSMAAEVLKIMIDNPYYIPEKLSDFKDAIESLASLIQTVGTNPLELDCFYLVPEGRQLVSDKKSAAESFIFSVRRFLGSFSSDYYSSDKAGDKKSKSISVWASTGRDQLQILNTLIDNYFIDKTGISVNLSLVNTGGTLIQATLAGKGPDVALMIDTATPVNLAMRGALVDLSDERFALDEIKDDFYASSWVHYGYNGGIYAIPETENFDVLFYRTDIFKELGLSAPETWEDFYRVLEVLQHNNLRVGIPEINSASPGVSSGISLFDKLLLQNGGAYYNEELTETRFDTAEAYSAFKNWIKLYKEYGLPRSYDFFNYFRSGEIAMALQNYSAYNQLKAAAPEIRGLWDIALIPGTVREDGSIDRSETAAGNACVMLQSAVSRGIEKEAFEFMRWWTGADAQSLYAQELEAVLGVVSRYTPASVKAFKSIKWTDKEREVIETQWQAVKNIPEIPGNYIISRELTNAFRKALKTSGNPERQLDIYNKTMNEEIARKRKEFTVDKGAEE